MRGAREAGSDGEQRHLRPLPRPGARGHPRLRRAAPPAHPVRRGPPDRADPGGGAAVPAHPRRARLRRPRRRAVPAAAAGARARLRVPVGARPARGRPAAHGAAVGPAARVVLGVGARRRRPRLRRPGPRPQDHEGGHRGRQPLPRLPDVDGAGAAGRGAPRTGSRGTSRGWTCSRSPRSRSPTSAGCARCWPASGSRATPSSTRSSSSGCAPWPCPSATAAARWWPP